jgi:UDP-N-acetylglucosamine--N-acetylmuramyl-(pentapeptide) pyrophosphoryl-undecaprenol N-acetylglucosamine transferase
MKRTVIIMATGGTGGHVFPAVAIAKKINELRDDVDVVFATDDRGLKYLGDFKDGAIVQNMKSRIGAPWFYCLICINTLKAIIQLRKNKNIIGVVGFGGYPSVPFTLASSICGRRTIIHEQNAIIGRANKMLASFKTDKVLMAFDEDVGTPTRFDDAYGTFKYSPSPKTSGFGILVLGGSQGSRLLTNNAVKALTSLPTSIRKKVYVYHQARYDELSSTCTIYRNASIYATVKDFFNEDEMKEIYQSVDIVISRSGASTIFEIVGFGLPSILVPFAQSVNGDQKANAEKLSSIGGAIMIEEKDVTHEVLASHIKDLFTHRDRLEQMSQAIRTVRLNTNSATKIANEIISTFLE